MEKIDFGHLSKDAEVVEQECQSCHNMVPALYCIRGLEHNQLTKVCDQCRQEIHSDKRKYDAIPKTASGWYVVETSPDDIEIWYRHKLVMILGVPDRDITFYDF